jgi:hypothetical protein
MHSGCAPPLIAARPRDANNVESRVALVELFLTKKELSRLNHLPLLSGLDGLQGRAKSMIRTRFYLNKNDHTPIQDNQVHFSSRASVVSLNYSVSLLAKI